MSIIKKPSAVDSPYDVTPPAPPTRLASAPVAGGGVATVAASAAPVTSTTANTTDANSTDANVSYYATGLEGIAGLANYGRVFAGANVYVTLENQQYNTYNQNYIGNGTVGGSNGQIQFNNNGAFDGSASLTFDGANIVVAGIKTDEYYYANGDPFSGGGNANTGNIGFANVTMYSLSGLSVNNSDLDHGYTAGLTIPNNGSGDIGLLNYYGNVIVTAGVNSGNTTSWSFDNDGNVSLPSGGVLGDPYGDNANTAGLQAGPDGYAIINSNDQKQYVQADDTSVYIGTDYTANNYLWTFDKSGNLTAPGNITANTFVSNAFNVLTAGNLSITSQYGLGVTGTILEQDGTLELIGNASGCVVVGWNSSYGTLGPVAQMHFSPAGNGGNIIVTTGNTAGTSYDWAFDNTGNLTTPTGAGDITMSGGNITGFNTMVGNQANVDLIAGSYTWTFANDGKFYTPESGQIRTSSPFYGISVLDYSGNSFVSMDASNMSIQGNDAVTIATNSGTQFVFTNGNLNAGNANISTTGYVSASGNVIAGANINAPGGFVNAAAVITSGRIDVGTNLSAVGQITGGNIDTGGVISATGNITGNYFIGNGSQLTGIVSNYGNANVVANLAALGTNLVSTTGNITGGNIRTGGLISSTGTITGSSHLGSVVSVTANITGGNILTGGLISATGNVTGSSHLGTVVSASGNITGGNLLTGGLISATANITGGNVLTAGIMSSTGNATHGNILTGGLISATGNVTAQNFIGNISITGNVTGTSANVSLVAGAYTYTFDNVGQLTMPTVGGDEGGQINLNVGTTNTTITGPVTVDIFRDKVRFFEGSANSKGLYIDLSDCPTNVGGEITYKSSGYVNSGVFVQLDNIKAQFTSSGNRGLSIAAVSTTFTAQYSGNYNNSGGAGGSSSNGSVNITTTPTTSLFGWNFAGAGDGITMLVNDNTNSKTYRITVMVGAGFSNNFISIERL